MPVISIANPKGGTGKSTTALILATALARSASVRVVDADPNRAIADWASGGGTANFSVVASAGADDVIDEIEAAARAAAFVIVDLEGTASSLVTSALAVSDFLIVPMQASPLDARHGARAVKLARNAERVSRRRIPVRVVMTNTGAAVKSKDFREITGQLGGAGVPLFETSIVGRAAFRAIFTRRQTLWDLDQREISGVPAAIENAESFAREAVEWMRAEREGSENRHVG